MKTSFYKNNLFAVALILGVSHAGLVSAHDQIGSLLGSASAGATDLYQITCGVDSAKLIAQLDDQGPSGPIMSLQIFKGAKAVTTTDTVGGDGAYSPLVSLTPPVGSGAGAYTVLVNHTGLAAESYAFIYHCESAAGAHTATGIVRLQNQ
jgi:hypothetical protein